MLNKRIINNLVISKNKIKLTTYICLNNEIFLLYSNKNELQNIDFFIQKSFKDVKEQFNFDLKNINIIFDKNVIKNKISTNNKISLLINNVKIEKSIKKIIKNKINNEILNTKPTNYELMSYQIFSYILDEKKYNQFPINKVGKILTIYYQTNYFKKNDYKLLNNLALIHNFTISNYIDYDLALIYKHLTTMQIEKGSIFIQINEEEVKLIFIKSRVILFSSEIKNLGYKLIFEKIQHIFDFDLIKAKQLILLNLEVLKTNKKYKLSINQNDNFEKSNLTIKLIIITYLNNLTNIIKRKIEELKIKNNYEIVVDSWLKCLINFEQILKEMFINFKLHLSKNKNLEDLDKKNYLSLGAVKYILNNDIKTNKDNIIKTSTNTLTNLGFESEKTSIFKRLWKNLIEVINE